MLPPHPCPVLQGVSPPWCSELFACTSVVPFHPYSSIYLTCKLFWPPWEKSRIFLVLVPVTRRMCTWRNLCHPVVNFSFLFFVFFFYLWSTGRASLLWNQSQAETQICTRARWMPEVKWIMCAQCSVKTCYTEALVIQDWLRGSCHDSAPADHDYAQLWTQYRLVIWLPP